MRRRSAVRHGDRRGLRWLVVPGLRHGADLRRRRGLPRLKGLRGRTRRRRACGWCWGRWRSGWC
jgi:hypothetical protein